MPTGGFYGPDLAVIHHEGFGDIAEASGALLLTLLHDAGHERGTVVDLACGTGILAGIVSDAGYEAVGFDLSSDMIAFARAHAPAARLEVRSVYDDVDLPVAIAFVASGEALNYASDPRAGLGGLAEVARRVRAAIEPEGVFLFDVATPGRAGPTGVRETSRKSASWTIAARTVESEDGSRLERSMTFTRRDAEAAPPAGEHHVCHLYEQAAVLDVLARSGFEAQTRAGYSDEATASTPLAGWCVVVARPDGT